MDRYETRRNLTLLHNNIRNLYNNRTELTHTITEHKPDIIALNETHLNPTDKFSQRGFTVFRKDRNRRGGGVAILCRDNLPVSLHKQPEIYDNIEQVTIKIEIKNFPVYVTSLYLPPGHPFPIDFFDHLNTFHKLILLGDLNASHTEFGDIYINAAGRRLRRFLHNSRMLLLDAGPTRFPTSIRQINWTAPDKILVSPPIQRRMTQLDVLPPMNSDHCPILLTINTPNHAPTTQYIAKTIFKYNKADWDSYREYINDKLPPPPDITNSNALIRADDLLLQVTLDARLRAVPHKQSRQHRQRELPPQIVQLIKTKRRAHRLYMRQHTDDNRRLYRSLQQDVKDAIRRYNTYCWTEITRKLDNTRKDDPTKFWTLLKKLKGQSSINHPLKDNNTHIYHTTQKLDIFRAHLQQIHSIQENPLFDQVHYNAITENIRENNNLYTPTEAPANIEHDNILTANITQQEVTNSINRTRNTAAGPDTIQNILLKQYPQKAIEFLTEIYRASFRMGILPPRWKHAHILLFPKPGKDHTDKKNYRPISLTATVCKVFERILNRRLQLYIQDNNLLPDTQAGFRQDTDIVDQLLKIMTPVEHGLETRKTTIMVALDTQRAFDSVWLDGLRYKLTRLALPSQFTRWISDFIRDRTAQIKINEHLSNEITIFSGVPQGTVLSPALFNLYVADIPIPQDDNVRLGQFADDVIYTSTSYRINIARRHINSTLQTLSTWLGQWRLVVNADKSQAMLIKKQNCPLGARARYPVLINNTPIPYKRNIKYLGVTFNDKLNLASHIHHLRKKLKFSIPLLYRMAGRGPEYPGCKPKTTMMIYKTIIRPSILYASQLYTRLSPTHMSQLCATERRLARKAFNLPRNTDNQTVYDVTRIQPISQYITAKNIKYVHNALDRPFIQHIFLNPPNTNPPTTVDNLLLQYRNRPP